MPTQQLLQLIINLSMTNTHYDEKNHLINKYQSTESGD
jgi:hypothetical protein